MSWWRRVFAWQQPDERPRDRAVAPGTPPDAERVAARAAVVGVLAWRAYSESQKGEKSEQTAQESFLYAAEWLGRIGASDELRREEVAFLLTPIGGLDEQSWIDANWLFQGVSVLVWSLGTMVLPRYDDDAADPMEVLQSIGFMADRSRTVLHKPVLRPRAEIERAASINLTLQWRMRQYQRERVHIDFADYVGKATWGPLTTDGLELIDNDLAVRGERIDRIPEHERLMLHSLSQERHRAFNWLLGHGPIYSKVATDT
jgi:hypothetical protein